MTDVQTRLNVLIEEHRGLRRLSVAISENAGYLSQVRRGKRRASRRLLAKLGLVNPRVRRNYYRSFVWLASLWASGKLR